MKEYIELDEAVKELCGVIAPTPSESHIIDKCIDKLDNMPTADVVEVVHAKWEWFDAWEGDDTLDDWKMLRCSNCFESEGARENAKFCSNCGAIMDLNI